jgi:hypothetical protein
MTQMRAGLKSSAIQGDSYQVRKRSLDVSGTDKQIRAKQGFTTVRQVRFRTAAISPEYIDLFEVQSRSAARGHEQVFPRLTTHVKLRVPGLVGL